MTHPDAESIDRAPPVRALHCTTGRAFYGQTDGHVRLSLHRTPCYADGKLETGLGLVWFPVLFYRLDHPGQEQEKFLFSKTSKPALRSIQPFLNGYRGTGQEADRSLLVSRPRMSGAIPLFPLCASMTWTGETLPV